MDYYDFIMNSIEEEMDIEWLLTLYFFLIKIFLQFIISQGTDRIQK